MAESPTIIPDVPEPEETPLIFRWRRFRFPSFKFFVMVLGAIVVHLIGFYMFELAKRGESKPVTDEAKVLILRSSDPESNRVLLTHFEALNAFEVSVNPREEIDAGIALARSFDDYNLEPVPMPEADTASLGSSFPSFLAGDTAALAPLGVEKRDTTEPAGVWQKPTSVSVQIRGEDSVSRLPVDLDDAFWTENFGKTLWFDLAFDDNGRVAIAVGEGATPDVLNRLKHQLLGVRLSADGTASPNENEFVWKRAAINLW